MVDGIPTATRSRIPLGVAMALVAVAALNFRAALPSTPLIHGAGHWIGAILLEGALIVALCRRRLSPGLIGFVAIGCAYLAWRAPDAAPAVSWWEDMLARWMVGAESRLRGVSWGGDRWYVWEAHVRSIQLATTMLSAAVGGFGLGLLRIDGRRPGVGSAQDLESAPDAPV